LLKESSETGHWTNGGPLVARFEKYLRDLLLIEDGKSVIVCNNGTSALHALVSGIELYEKRAYNWATQAFTFPSSCEGPLKDAKIVDIGDGYGPDIASLDDCDAVVVTNLFGHLTDIKKYEALDKLMIYDNATAAYSFYNDRNAVNYGTGCIISLHHTKPIGFGECGVIVVDKKYETSIRNICNFGISNTTGEYHTPTLRMGSNYKVSDISVAFVFQHIEKNFYRIVDHHRRLCLYMQKCLENLDGFRLLGSYDDDVPFVSCLAVVADKYIDANLFVEKGVYARKYYTPIDHLAKSLELHKKILCFPCHLDMNLKDIDYIVEILSGI